MLPLKASYVCDMFYLEVEFVVYGGIVLCWGYYVNGDVSRASSVLKPLLFGLLLHCLLGLGDILVRN